MSTLTKEVGGELFCTDWLKKKSFKYLQGSYNKNSATELTIQRIKLWWSSDFGCCNYELYRYHDNRNEGWSKQPVGGGISSLWLYDVYSDGHYLEVHCVTWPSCARRDQRQQHPEEVAAGRGRHRQGDGGGTPVSDRHLKARHSPGTGQGRLRQLPTGTQ